MVNFKHFLANVALAAAMIGACGQAAATPLGYHVDINTATLVLSFADFQRFLNATGHEPTFIRV